MEGMSGKAAKLSKITRPMVLGCLHRKRLYRLLDGTRKRPIMWVKGPPGSGKTTLVSSFLQARKLPSLWYQVDSNDGDPATFFHYLGTAAKAASTRRRVNFPVLAPEFRTGLSVFTRRFFEIFFGCLPKGSVVVFDNCHDAPHGSPILEILLEGIGFIPEGMGVFFISRSDPPPGFSRFRAAQRMGILGWRELRLSSEEIDGIIRLKWKRGLPKDLLRNLQERSDGWAAGLILLMEGAAGGNLSVQSLKRQEPGEIFDYFAGEILEKFDEEARDFLLRSAFLPRMTARMAEALTGTGRAGHYLSLLNRNNCFTDIRPGNEPVFEYHSLFREFLLSRSAGILSSSERDSLRKAAAKILEKAGSDEEAMGLFRETGDVDGMAGIVRNAARSLVAQGRNQTLLDWLRLLPPRIVESDPWLLYWTGVCRLPVQPEESRRCFEEALPIFRDRRDPSGVFLSWAGIVDSLMYGYGGLSKLDRWFPLLGDYEKEYGGFPTDEVEVRATSSMIRAMALRRPKNGAMSAWVGKAVNLARKTSDPAIRIEILIHLACYHYSGCELEELGMLLESLRTLVDRPDVPLLARLNVRWVEAAHANITSAYARCLEAVADGLSLADASGIHVMDYVLAGQGALCCLKCGDLQGCSRYLRRMESSLVLAKPWEASYYHYVEGWEALIREDMVRARRNSERCLGLCEEVGNPWMVSIAHLLGAQVAEAGGELEAAREHLEKACRTGQESGNVFVRFACLLTKASFLLFRGDEKTALEALREGMRIGRERGYANLYMSRPGVLETVTAKALEAGIEPSYVMELVQRNDLSPGDAHIAPEGWPWPLRIHTFGGFELLKEGNPIPHSRKVQRIPLQLLKALVASGGKDVPEGKVADILWPNAEGDMAHQSFTTTLRRLRRLLGIENAIVLSVGRLSLSDRLVWADVPAFERLLEMAATTAVSDKAGIRYLATALAVYKGPFLSTDAAEPWIGPFRERLRNRFLRAALELGRRLETSGQWEEASLSYQKAIDMEPFAEELYRSLLICHARLGRNAEAMDTYRRFRRMCAVNGAVPSTITETFFHSLFP
jgi:ATP/maltotriose-dependent transcriptional regulator MalT/DNA-binding SARP family transcriptional activator